MGRHNGKVTNKRSVSRVKFRLALSTLALAMGAAGNVQADLIGVVQTFPDITLTASPYLVYDHNGVDASTGLLRIFSGGSSLAEGAVAGGSSQTQSYFSAGDTIPDLMISILIDNSTGVWMGGSVSIGYGNNAALPRYSWAGDVTDFGFQNDGKFFDATWNVSADQYQNMPGTMSQFVNGYLADGPGGIKISNSYGFGTGSFASDWIFGSAAQTTTALNGYIGALETPLRANSTVTVDVFATPVPLPAAVWLLGSGLVALGSMTLRRRVGKEQE